ncbi:ThiF family adenylyltransferase [Microbacterium halophytorum]|uniref:ThiF family adenylyltransferase n=1 Tax=Microbacterium halophytorum TaxID=2067568 RepID=UPI000CFB2E6D|nr:ThiF family adenylyltransferase [Microbacterium halophytorum]
MSAFPPLVEPVPSLGREQRIRYARQIALPAFGEEGQRRVAAARVLVIGAGGLGTPVLAALAAAGVGTIGVVDDDDVEASNLHRQLLHATADLGRPKTTSAAESMRAANPGIEVREHRLRIDADSAAETLRGYDLVVDGSDNFATRYVVADAAEALGLPVVWAAVLGFTGQVSVFWPPHGPAYRDLHPDVPAEAATCASGGVLGMVCHALGAVMAAEAVKLIAGMGEALLGRLMLFDALSATWRTIEVRPDPGRAGAASMPSTCAGPTGAERGDLSGADAAAIAPGVLEPSAGRAGSAPPAVTPGALAREIAVRDDLVVIDVREPGETDGALPGAWRIGMRELPTHPRVAALAADTPIVTACATGARAARAAAALAARGFTNARSLAGFVGAARPS